MTITTKNDDDVLATTDVALREEALRRLKKRQDLNGHILVYVLVNLAVWGIWIAVGVGSHSWWPWPVFLTLFWGIGLATNAWDVYVRRPITRDQLKHEIERLKESE